MKSYNSVIDQLFQNRPLLHSLFWALSVLFFSFLAALNTGEFWSNFVTHLALLPVQLIAAYSLVYYLFPRYFMRKRYLIFTLSLLLSVYIFTVLARLSVVYLAEPFIRTDFDQESLWEIISDPIYLLAIYVPATYLIVFIFFALKNIKDRFEEKHQMEVLQKEKANNELRFLKAQIHPHFLFNTLNNLYALTLEQSKKHQRWS